MSTYGTLSPTDKALAKIADLIVQRMEELKGEQWQKPWFSSSYQGQPQNITGRAYQGMNELILDFVTTTKNHELPVFLTFNQASKEGVHINKGASSIPVLYYERSYKDAAGHTVHIPDEKFTKMSEEERARLTPQVLLRKFDVFNIADTNFQEVKPELYEKFKQQYAVSEIKDEQGMYSNKELDRMFAKQEWLCPIEIKQSTSAFYTPSSDSIILPLKAQFKTSQTAEGVYRDGMEFYSTAIHEMAHSTGNSNRLDRTKGKLFGDPAYAKEELVAELTAALVGRSLGFDRQVTDNSAKYLNNWVGALKSEPRFILNVLSDVSKATSMIMAEVENQRQSINIGQTQKFPKGKSLFELEAQYSNINARYPFSVDNDAKRQVVKRISQAESIIATYHKNIEKAYGTQFLFDEKNAHVVIPKSIYASALSEKEKSAVTVSETAIVKMRNGDFAVRGKIDGVDTGLMPVDRKEAIKYFRMENTPQKESFLQGLVQSIAQQHSSTPQVKQSINHRM